MIAEIILNSNVKNLDRVFDYAVPETFSISVGDRVQVPFGNQKKLEEGFVVSLKETTNYKVKAIQRAEKGIDQEKMELAKWIARRYFCNLSDAIKLMLPPGTTTKKIEKRAKEKNVTCYMIAEEDKVRDILEQGKIKSDKQLRALTFLLDNEFATLDELSSFVDVSRAVMQTLEKHGMVQKIEKQVERNPFLNRTVERTSKLNLTEEQSIAYEKIERCMNREKFSEFLLYGVTGSGKTEIYLQLIEKVLEKGKSAIMLVPEISLTPQMVSRFLARFGEEKLAVLHSKLSIGERYDSWQKIQRGDAKIVIGARSAIFAPVQDLGLIIIDEEHDVSYKSEMAPRYHALAIAEKIAQDKNIPLLLGSATPCITEYYRAKEGNINLLTLSQRANKAKLPEIKVVDMREELAKGNRSMLSTELYSAMKENLEKKKQTILFLNRRGFSTFIMCRDCGYTVKCKNCNISMTYHKGENKLKCHYCGQEEPLVTVCPICGSKKIRYFGTGTQKLEEEIHKIFKEASTIRMDVDTVTKKNSHEEILETFTKKRIDILIGTQMVVKGHHFPNVTLVGVVAADSSLNMGDYLASERTFDLLVQVAGRAGREQEQGKAIIQTYNPDHFCIQLAQRQDYENFYQSEIALRKQLKYPPFCDIIVVEINGEEEEKVVQICQKYYLFLKEKCKERQLDTLVLKPMPCPVSKIKNRYRWRVILKEHLTEDLISILQNTMTDFLKEKNKNLRMIIDTNPTSMI